MELEHPVPSFVRSPALKPSDRNEILETSSPKGQEYSEGEEVEPEEVFNAESGSIPRYFYHRSPPPQFSDEDLEDECSENENDYEDEEDMERQEVSTRSFFGDLMC